MRYILFMFMILVCSRNVNAQLNDNQIRVRPSQEPDSILVMSNDTNSSSIYYKTGKWRKLSDLIGSVAGDTDWYKVGGTAIPTNSDSAYRSGYTLFTGLYGGLATKIEMLKDGVIQFDSEDGNTDQNFIRFKPLQDGTRNVDFLMSSTTTHFSGSRDDNVFYWGWNLGAGGGVVESGKGAIGLSMEDFYNPLGTNAYSEFHLIHIDTTGVSRRPFTMFMDVGNSSTWSSTFSVADFNLTMPDDIAQVGLEFTMPDGIRSQLKMMNPANGHGVEMLTNDASNEFQITNTMGGGSEIYLNSFTYCETNILRRAASFGSTATTIAGNDGSGWFTNVGTGWGIDLTSGNLVVDSSQVATQYDLTTVSGGATDLIIGGSGPTYTIESSTGTDVTIAAGTGVSLSESPANTLVITNTVTDTDDQGLTLTGTGPYTIDIDNGSDIIVDDLFGIILSEPTANTLGIKADTSVLATPYDITQIPINYIKAATATNTAAHANYGQEWSWNSLNGSGLKLSSTSTASSSTNHKLFEISTTGVNGSSGATTYGAYLSNTHSGTTSTNYGLYSAASGAASKNYAIYGEANGSNGYGVTGISASNVGVLGAGAIGVYGSATSGIGVYSTATSGLALSGNATSGTGLEAIVTSGIPISVQDNSAGTNTVEPMIQMYHLTTGTAAAGIGSSIVYNTEASDGADYVSNRLKSIWTTATAGSRVSSFIFSGVNAATEADILTLKGSKQLQFHGYGTGGAFTASPVADLFVDATGNVVQGSMTGQSWTADADDATTPTLISNQTLKIAGASGITTDLFDNVSTDSITIAVNGKEFTKVTALQSDDFLLLHDSISQTNERILWSDVIIDLISFKDGNSSVGTGNAIDVGEGLDISMSPSTEANINLDASEFLLDGTNETDESFLVYDPDTTAGHRIQRIPWSDVVGGSDTNWAEDDLTVTGNRLHDMAGFFVTYTGTAMQTYFQNEAIAGNTGNTLVLVSEAGASGTGIVGGISYQSENSGSPTEMYDIQAEKWSSTRSTLTFSGEQSSDAEISYEKNADLSDNTTESHISINGGVAFTQNYDYSTAADLELDRSYHILNVTGGAATDTIKLPEVAQSTDNWSSSLSATQVQVGQEYVITNFRSATNLVVAAYNPTSGNSDLINSQTNITTYSAIIMPANTSLKFRCVRLASGVGYWYTY